MADPVLFTGRLLCLNLKPVTSWPSVIHRLSWRNKVMKLPFDDIQAVSSALLQPRRCVPQHHHGGGLPDDHHPLQLGWVSICSQGCSLLCRPKLWLPAAAAGVPDDTSVRGKRMQEPTDMMYAQIPETHRLQPTLTDCCLNQRDFEWLSFKMFRFLQFQEIHALLLSIVLALCVTCCCW